MNKKLRTLCVLLSGCLWGTTGLFVRELTNFGYSIWQIVAARALTTLVIFVLVALLFDRRAFRVRLRDLWIFAGMGLISVVVFNWCYFTCMNSCSLPVAATLMYTSPVFAILLAALLFRERINLRVVLAMLAAILGCVIVSGLWRADIRATPLGVILGLCSGLFYALYSIFSRIAFRRYSPLTANLYAFVFASIGALALAGPADFIDVLKNTASIPYALGVGVMTAALPYWLFSYGLQTMQISTANVLVMDEIVVVTLLSVFVYHESIKWYTAVGMALVLAAVILLTLPKKAKKAVQNGTEQTS